MARSIPANAIQAPLGANVKRSYSNKEYGQVIKMMREEGVDFETASNFLFADVVKPA